MENKPKNTVINYLKLTILFAVVIIFILITRKIYQNYLFYSNQNSILYNIINEAKSKDIDNYLVENPDTIVYICSSNEKVCQDFDLKLKKYLNTLDHLSHNKIVYLNIIDSDNKDEFLDSFAKKHAIKTPKYPSFVVFKNGKAEQYIYDKDTNKTLNSIKANEKGLLEDNE